MADLEFPYLKHHNPDARAGRSSCERGWYGLGPATLSPFGGGCAERGIERCTIPIPGPRRGVVVDLVRRLQDAYGLLCTVRPPRSARLVNCELLCIRFEVTLPGRIQDIRVTGTLSP